MFVYPTIFFFQVKTAHLFSDGAGQHFKQRGTLHCITMLCELLEIPRDRLNLYYNFFATSHGKGAVDGVGGTVKRQVRAEVMTRREVISNAEQYSIVAKKCSDKIDIIYLGKSEIEESIPILEDMMKDTKVLPGTRKMHHLEVTGPGQVILIHF